MFKIADALTNGNNVNVEYNNLFYNNTKIRWTQAPTDCSNTITLVLLYDWIKYKKKTEADFNGVFRFGNGTNWIYDKMIWQ